MVEIHTDSYGDGVDGVDGGGVDGDGVDGDVDGGDGVDDVLRL